MNCEDISRILDSRDVNTMPAAERRAGEAHAATCPHCGPEWIVFTRLAAIPAARIPQQLRVRCEALAEARLGGQCPPGRTILLGTILVVAAAAAMLVAHLTSAPPKAVAAQESIPAAKPAEAAAAPATPTAANPATEAAVQPSTVLLVLDQATNDATGREYGRQVYEHAREELRALPGLVLVDAAAAAAAAPAFRITYLNLAKSGRIGEELAVQVELVFEVQALRPGADGAGTYQPVFRSSPPPPGVVDMPPAVARQEMIPSFNDEPMLLMSSARMSARPANRPALPADCIERREGRCPYTPADVAAFTILSWRLQTNSPDRRLVERLHAMLRDSSTPPGLWFMGLINLRKYGKLHLDMAELLAASERIGGEDPALEAELMRDVLTVDSRPVLMRWLRDRLLSESLPGDRVTTDRMRLLELLATELKNEPGTQAILESVAATDPVFEVRAAAKRALGAEPEPAPKPQPTPSFMGPIDEQ
jgi:hypothetical protein